MEWANEITAALDEGSFGPALEDCGLRPTFAHHGLVLQAAGLVR
jgi:hypothetical protein